VTETFSIWVARARACPLEQYHRISGRIRETVDDGVGWLVFDHPPKRNAVSRAMCMWKLLPNRLAALEGDDTVGGLVLRGAGEDGFVSGADTSQFLSDAPALGTAVQPPEIRYALQCLDRFPNSILAMIHGACLGGGLEIALRADLRFGALGLSTAGQPPLGLSF
jgi:enoyl-CoA hydratase/carnithine racemase